MTDLVVKPADKPLRGSVPVPSDKSIGHRALMIAALANGKSRIENFSGGADNIATAAAFRAMGVEVTINAGDSGDSGVVSVVGAGLFGLRRPSAPLDCGNSGTTMRLMLGLLSPQPFDVEMFGDESLSRRPMGRVVEPLRQRGARIEAAGPRESGAKSLTAPLRVLGCPEGQYLSGIEFQSPVASAQVKSALLLSGLYAHGATFVQEPYLSRDHTERMFEAAGVPLSRVGSWVRLDPSGWNGQLEPINLSLPGDVSAAAFLVAAAQLVPGSNVTVRDVGVNPTRTGFLEIARDMGAGLTVQPVGERGGEPVATLHAFPGDLRGGRVGGELVPRAIDEIPIACALAAVAEGDTRVVDASELRVKESDRIRTMADLLRSSGVECDEQPDGMTIRGRSTLKAFEAHSHGDHRIAMTAAVLALRADGPCTIRDADCIATSFPKFVGTLRALGATIDVK